MAAQLSTPLLCHHFQHAAYGTHSVGTESSTSSCALSYDHLCTRSGPRRAASASRKIFHLERLPLSRDEIGDSTTSLNSNGLTCRLFKAATMKALAREEAILISALPFSASNCRLRGTADRCLIVYNHGTSEYVSHTSI
ncbi:hypothetical protein P280DRAFT_466788 [Massarina eburnea CBS 473.64]|uniref:Uncharacterized protein n=1 Tax=Massarina eburnea CBS 473.64 TaxID=1395130 RepID=A0A6A6SA66_9PLEO|nr:hypothetical protein P280DRAFT_466788 [Massarina eburnea CBS 473.64]